MTHARWVLDVTLLIWSDWERRPDRPCRSEYLRDNLSLILLLEAFADDNSRQAKALQSSLQALAERIEAVKSDHDKLESENKFLQDYIGGLTRNMTKSEMTRSSTKVRKSHK